MSLDVLGLALPLFVAVPLLAGGLLVIAGERPGLHRRALLWLLGLSSLGGAGLIAGLFHHPAALGPDAPVAHVEDLHRRFELVGVESDDVGVSVLP